jgi:signal transduction histidine kinase
MQAIAWQQLRSPGISRLDVAWGGLWVACLAAMIAWPSWETVPFHVVWISLTVLYGFRVWPLHRTALVLGAVMTSTGALILGDALRGLDRWGELIELPLLAAMFAAMVWHAQRRVSTLHAVQALAAERADLLQLEEQLLHDVSHELRTPVTIARGHLELLQRELGGPRPELSVAFDELARIDSIVDRLLLLARAERPDSAVFTPVPLLAFLEDVFIRWAEIAPRAWQLGEIADVTLEADETWLRTALDALLENAVRYTEDYAPIALSARCAEGDVLITVADGGPGIAPDAIDQIFQRFARSDAARTRHQGGAGLGLAIVQAIARAHDGSCSVRSEVGSGAVFELRLPLVRGAAPQQRPHTGAFPAAFPGLELGSA